MSSNISDVLWKPGAQGAHANRANKLDEGTIYQPEFFEHIASTIAALDEDLHKLSKDIHGW